MILLNGRASISPGPERGLVGGASRSSSHGIFCALKMGVLGEVNDVGKKPQIHGLVLLNCGSLFSSTRETPENLYTVPNRIVMDRCSTTANS